MPRNANDVQVSTTAAALVERRTSGQQAVSSADLRALITANRNADTAVQASTMSAAQKQAFAEVLREIRLLTRLLGKLAEATGVYPATVPTEQDVQGG